MNTRDLLLVGDRTIVISGHGPSADGALAEVRNVLDGTRSACAKLK